MLALTTNILFITMYTLLMSGAIQTQNLKLSNRNHQEGTTKNEPLKVTIIKRGNCRSQNRIRDGDIVSVYYTGKLAKNGQTFDSNKGSEEPLSFRLGDNEVIAGWEKGILGSCPGDILELFIPPHLAYGRQGAGNGLIPPNSTLKFKISIKNVEKGLTVSSEKSSTRLPPSTSRAPRASSIDSSQISRLFSSSPKLQKHDITVEVLKKGDCSNDKKTRRRDRVEIQFIGKLINGTVWARVAGNEKVQMTIGSTGIDGWDKAVSGACIGELRRVYIPSNLGYGKTGVPDQGIPPNADLVLEITIINIEDRVLSFLDRISSGTFG